jgi:hypothetical protein
MVAPKIHVRALLSQLEITCKKNGKFVLLKIVISHMPYRLEDSTNTHSDVGFLGLYEPVTKKI